METIQKSTNWRMERHGLAYTHNGIKLFGNLKSTDTGYNVDETWKHKVKLKTADTQGYTLYLPIYMECLEKASP